jgi:hypothetical protein
MSFEAMADAQYAHEKGRDRAGCEWILSDRDAWYRNPFYTGPRGRHPEDDCYDDYPEPTAAEQAEADAAAREAEAAWQASHSAHVEAWLDSDRSCEIPF